MPDGSLWPKVSVVTPSYNQGQFIEETVRSVLLQGYPDLEYIVIDGGSTDNTLDVLRTYSPWLAHWVSEPDRGQSHAINKGWERAKGQAITWLNSDDRLEPGSLASSASGLFCDPGADLVYGDVDLIDEHSRLAGQLLGRPFVKEAVVLWRARTSPQPGFLMHRRLLDSVGWLDENLHLVMDYDYWVRFALTDGVAHYTGRTLAGYRIHTQAKTSRFHALRIKELYEVLRKALDDPRLPTAYLQQRQAWKSGLHLDAARIAHEAGDTALARRYAVRHVWSAKLRASPWAVKYLGRSLLGTNGVRIASRLYRSAARVLDRARS